MTGSEWFNVVIYIVIVVNSVPIFYAIFWDFVTGSKLTPAQDTFLFICTLVFTSIYLLEFLLKVRTIRYHGSFPKR
jgi:hypothetical protein